MPENPTTAASLWSRIFCPQLNLFQLMIMMQDSICSRLRASFPTLRSHVFNNIRMRAFNTRFAQTMEVIIPTLVALLESKYQATNQTPFTTHPYTMATSVLTAFGYFLACNAQLYSWPAPLLTCIAHHCMVFFGNILAASLASVFFSDSMRPLLYLLSLLMCCAEFFHMVIDQTRFMEDLGGRVFHGRFMRRLGRISSFGRRPILPR